MRPDVPAVDREFDYAVPDAWQADGRASRLGVGTIVRVPLHGRRVRGWVTNPDTEPPPGVELQPLAKITGQGPSDALVELARWAAWRWAGPMVSFLRTASPPRAVTVLAKTVPAKAVLAKTVPAARSRVPASTVPANRVPIPSVADELVRDAVAMSSSVLRLPPGADTLPVALAAAGLGDALVLAPGHSAATMLVLRLRRAGVAVASVPDQWADAAAGGTVVGARAAAWAPGRELAAVVVLDEHDEAYKEERSPTWHARDVAVERARRAGVPCVLVSPTPTLEALDWGTLLAPSRSEERAGWPVVDIVDRRSDEPGRTGLYSQRVVQALRQSGRALCVLNRKGRSRLLACASCGELARCGRCGSAVAQTSEGRLRCRRCSDERPPVCAHCGDRALKNLRVGVTRAREELEALVGEPVGEVTAETDTVPDERVYVGTEAVLHRVSEADAVVFLDFDQELMAPRYRTAEQAFALLVRAARLVGGRDRGGRLVVQTRLPQHEVIQAALHADPGRLSAAELERRTELRYPPVVAMAVVSGVAAQAFIERLGSPPGVERLGPSDGRWLLRASDHAALADALAATSRPPGRLRIEVDPLRV